MTSEENEPRGETPVAGVSAEERFAMIEKEAYVLAEKNGFAGDPVEYWIAAEKEVLSRCDKQSGD